MKTIICIFIILILTLWGVLIALFREQDKANKVIESLNKDIENINEYIKIIEQSKKNE